MEFNILMDPSEPESKEVSITPTPADSFLTFF